MIVVNIEKKRIKEAPPYDPDAAIPREIRNATSRLLRVALLLAAMSHLGER
jgi:hypothetical protein